MKKKVVIPLLILCCCIIISLFFVLSQKSEFIDYSSETWVYDDRPNVSLVSLIADPEKYHGEAVRICGIVHIGFESNAIFLSDSDYKYSNFDNALWLDIDEHILGTTYKELQKANGKYVTIEGNVDAYGKGHFSLYSCEIDNITRLYYDS